MYRNVFCFGISKNNIICTLWSIMPMSGIAPKSKVGKKVLHNSIFFDRIPGVQTKKPALLMHKLKASTFGNKHTQRLQIFEDLP